MRQVHRFASAKHARRLTGRTAVCAAPYSPQRVNAPNPLNRPGLWIASTPAVAGVWRFQDLVAWQLAWHLKQRADVICEKHAVRRDFRFAAQLRDAAASGPANIAEGFGRNFHPEFARFTRIARASEMEVINHLIDARGRGYVNEIEFDQTDHSAKKALKAINGLIRYLEATPKFGRE
ncbi:MAG: four helix bundle protein [Vicinamibacterales bacterium]